jgi:SAM-dependent methyltransferase
MRLRWLLIVLLAAGALLAAPDWSSPQGGFSVTAQNPPDNPKKSPELRKPDIHFVPTPPEVVDEMLRMADIKKGDILYDLGSGDGRIVIAAAKKYGIRAVGIDIDPDRIKEARENAEREGVSKLVEFRNEDLFEADFHEATVVTLYLLESLNEKLRPKLWRELKPGTRIVSHAFRMGDWEPEKSAEVDGRMVYFWTIPRSAKPN